MKLPRVFFTSIRFKIFVLYAIALFLALSFFNVLVCLDYKDTLERKIDALLDAKIQAVESAVHTYWEAQASVPQPEGWFADLFGAKKKTGPDDPYDTVIRFLTEDVLAPNPTDLKIYVDVFDPNGRLIDSSHPDYRLHSLDESVLRRALAGQKIRYRFMMQSEKGPSAPGRALAKALMVDGKVKDIIQARVPMKLIRKELYDLAVKLFLRSLVVVLLASGGSFFLVKSTLWPVDQMSRTIRNVKSSSLDQRIHVPATADEIARLAETFNAMLERLDRSFRSQEQIVQDSSHELKTPLTIIRGQIEVLLKKPRSTAEYKETLSSVLEEVVKLRHIVDNLLLLAKFDSPGLLPEMKDLDLNHLLEGILQDIRFLGQEKELEVIFSPRGEPKIFGNQVHLERLFRNLLENAVKYNYKRGKIRVICETDRSMAKVTIQDSGIGIPKADQDKIFGRFYRVDQARSSGEGFGLGLSIAKSIVELHHGRIEVLSKPGEGTSFFVWLRTSAFGHFLPA